MPLSRQDKTIEGPGGEGHRTGFGRSQAVSGNTEQFDPNPGQVLTVLSLTDRLVESGDSPVCKSACHPLLPSAGGWWEEAGEDKLADPLIGRFELSTLAIIAVLTRQSPLDPPIHIQVLK